VPSSADPSIPVHFLPLAAADLREAAAAAAWLRAFRSQEHPATEQLYLARAVETGMIVSYWRPFSTINNLGSLPDKYVAAEHRELHELLHELRDKGPRPRRRAPRPVSPSSSTARTPSASRFTRACSHSTGSTR
jgi:hypothetical protein